MVQPKSGKDGAEDAGDYNDEADVTCHDLLTWEVGQDYEVQQGGEGVITTRDQTVGDGEKHEAGTLHESKNGFVVVGAHRRLPPQQLSFAGSMLRLTLKYCTPMRK